MKYFIIFLNVFTFFSLSLAIPEKVWSKDKVQSEKSEIGRLFSQPAERQNLDALRKNNRLYDPKIITKNAEPAAENTIELPQPVTLQGYVKRSDGGKSTVWINHQPIQENSQLNGVNVGKLTQHREPAFGKKSRKIVERLEINIPATGKHLQLKAGQKYEPETNRIKEVTTVAKEKQVLLESVDEDGTNPD